MKPGRPFGGRAGYKDLKSNSPDIPIVFAGLRKAGSGKGPVCASNYPESGGFGGGGFWTGKWAVEYCGLEAAQAMPGLPRVERAASQA